MPGLCEYQVTMIIQCQKKNNINDRNDSDNINSNDDNSNDHKEKI